MIEKNVKLWLGDGPLVRVPVSQFDTAWRFVFSVIYNSVEWIIPTGATAVLNGRKPDGNVFAFSGTVSNNTVTVDADIQMTAVAGETICELSILADGKTVGTANFMLAVEAAPKSPDDVSSDSTLPAYAEMLEMFSGDIEDEVDSWLNAHSSQIGGLTNEAKQALLTLLAHVAYIDDQGQTYLDALEAALYPPADLVSISAVFAQGENVIYDTDTLDTLKQYLTVTALYSDSTTEVVNDYTLSGTLTVGTSTITVSYGGKTDTFNVLVTRSEGYVTSGLLGHWDAINNTGSGHSGAATVWKDLAGSYDLTISDTSKVTWKENAITFSGEKGQHLSSGSIWERPTNATLEIVLKPTSTATQVVASFDKSDESISGGFDRRGLMLYSDNTVGFVGKSGTTYANSENSITDVRVVVATYTDFTVNDAYINGEQVTKSDKTHSFATSLTEIVLGQNLKGSYGNLYTFTGDIYAIRYYNKVLSPSEIAMNIAYDNERFELGL